MSVYCQFKNTAPFTVGSLRELVCRGDFSSLKLPIQFQFQNKKYALHILEVKSFQPHELILTVTSYQVGSYKLLPVQITDGQTTAFVEPLSWEVFSVIKDEKQAPHPPYGPWIPSLPSWYFGAWGILSLFILGFVFMRIKNWRKKEQMIRRVQERLGDLTPLQYFIKQMSYFISYQKSSSSVKEDLGRLNQCLREFLENYLYISTEDSLKNVFKNEKIKSDQKITQILLELQKSLDNRYSKEDVEQLLDMVRSWVFKEGKK